MNILHISAYAFRGGVEKNCFHFIKATPEFEHEIIVLGEAGPMIAEWNGLGIKVTVLKLLESGMFSFWRGLRKRLPNSQFNKVIVWTNMRMPLVISAMNKYNNVTIYIHIGNPVQASFSTLAKNIVLSWLLPVNNKIYLRPVSEFVQKSLEKDRYYSRFKRKVSLKPITTPDFLVKTPTFIEPTSPVMVGMIARMDGIKDHKTIIKSFVSILLAYPNAKLNLAGDGALREELQVMSEELGLSHSIVFHGDVADVYSLMRNWDLFVYATTWQEGLSGTIPEALSMGLPVVSVELPMIREWDREARFVVFCKPFDPDSMATKVIELLKNTEKRKTVYENAPKYIRENFSSASFAANYIADHV